MRENLLNVIAGDITFSKDDVIRDAGYTVQHKSNITPFLQKYISPKFIKYVFVHMYMLYLIYLKGNGEQKFRKQMNFRKTNLIHKKYI